ncbi:hypothetical protein EYF80_052698 [Liparis tanakae]|uniref:Uncharacterized protein n=1 Tax=Liparis tanakae TaxID=230148 RepID=A0A4Z2F7A7_9TELE|nr:hypothetical protein EYF80_052698 [Liparis tanakae]
MTMTKICSLGLDQTQTAGDHLEPGPGETPDWSRWVCLWWWVQGRVQKEAGDGAKRGDQSCVTGGGGSTEDGIVAGSGTSSGFAGSVTGGGKSQAGADDLWTGAEDLSPDLGFGIQDPPSLALRCRDIGAPQPSGFTSSVLLQRLTESALQPGHTLGLVLQGFLQPVQSDEQLVPLVHQGGQPLVLALELLGEVGEIRTGIGRLFLGVSAVLPQGLNAALQPPRGVSVLVQGQHVQAGLGQRLELLELERPRVSGTHTALNSRQSTHTTVKHRCVKACVSTKAVSQLTVTHRPEATPLATSGNTSDMSSHVIGPHPRAYPRRRATNPSGRSKHSPDKPRMCISLMTAAFA